ncbi:MAG: hypothetical protein WCO05_04410 [Candidatus Moraniibacteriota bacterium]|jgi:hypothetical protein
MKITPNGVALFAAIEMARKEKKNQKCDLLQTELTVAPKMLSLEHFVEIFPLEVGVRDRIVAFTKNLGKANIDGVTVALFFGGDECAEYVKADLREKGFVNGAAMALLLFRLLMPIKIKKAKKGEGYSGLYVNNGAEVIFTHLQLLCGNADIIEAGPVFFTCYGYIISSCEKRIYGPVLEEQVVSEIIYGACARIGAVDCRKILSPLHFIKR